jgi:hypothetical protein
MTAPGGENDLPDFSGVISESGAHLYWSDLETGAVYVRDNPTRAQSAVGSADECTEPAKACTVLVSGAESAKYWTATPDGRFAYYTEGGRLWRFDAVADARTALTPPGSNVQGVIGVNRLGPDGANLYFVAGGALAAGSEARTCELEPVVEEEQNGILPAGRGCNLYLLHTGEPPRLVAALAASDNDKVAPEGENGNVMQGGDWQPNMGVRTAELAPDGEGLVFESMISLTGYDNRREPLEHCGNSPGGPACDEVFVYNASEDRLSCASCAPSGHRPVGGAGAENLTDTILPTSASSTSLRRWISADGDQVFFETGQPLDAVDHNAVQDVYEWARQGTPSCPTGSAVNDGCVSIISGGSSSDFSFFIDSSESGSDAFIATREPLLPGNEERAELYDARVGGGFLAPAGGGAGCEGANCREAASQPPNLSTPPSIALVEGGSSVGATTAVPSLKPTACKKGYTRAGSKCVKRKVKCKKRYVRKRGRCMRRGQAARPVRRTHR